ncbi:hypothetical protein [Actinophytocola sediminis]
MTATPFALISTEDRAKIVAYGLDIDLPSGRDVVTFRREADGRSSVAVHRSVEAARRRFGMVTPVELVWEPDCPSRTDSLEDR